MAGNGEAAQELLVKKYGFVKGTKLYGYWSVRQAMTREQVLEQGANKRTAQHWEREIIGVGLSMKMAEKRGSSSAFLERKGHEDE